MLLKETINDMCSSDYKARFGAEYWQVRIRAEKLEKKCSRIGKMEN